VQTAVADRLFPSTSSSTGMHLNINRTRNTPRAFRAALAACLCLAAPASAQTSRQCAFLCAPTITLMPGVLRTHLFGGPTVRSLSSGDEHRLPSSTNAEIILSVASQSAIPRLSLFGSLQWLPNATEARNPFTLYTASELGTSVRANAPTATFGVSGSLLPATQTHGWVDLALNVGDLFSQAARPDDKSSYTHKLDLDLVTHVDAFAWTPKSTWIHRVSIFGILDYVATGIPRAGDVVPQGREFMTRARPTGLIIGLALPVTPAVH
jgi:hypothetical protein